MQNDGEIIVESAVKSPEDVKRWMREIRCRLGAMNGATIDDWVACWVWQENRCAICREPAVFPYLSIDHDHDTGEFRGLLCWRCNLAEPNDDGSSFGARSHGVRFREQIDQYLASPPARNLRKGRLTLLDTPVDGAVEG